MKERKSVRERESERERGRERVGEEEKELEGDLLLEYPIFNNYRKAFLDNFRIWTESH